METRTDHGMQVKPLHAQDHQAVPGSAGRAQPDLTEQTPKQHRTGVIVSAQLNAATTKPLEI